MNKGKLVVLGQRFNELLWGTDIAKLPAWQAFFLTTGRILFRIISDIKQGQLTLRAMSLVYTTLLSLVPLLALSFSMLKAFGVHNRLEPLLISFLTPLGDKGSQFASQIVQFVENINVGVLGSLGLMLLIFTVMSLIQKVESSFNFIWHVASLRNIAQRMSGYLSVVMVGPLLVVTAIGITASVASAGMVRDLIAIEPFGTLFYGLSKLLPYLLVIGAFTATYLIIPNTTVRLRSALVGGVVAGVLWESVGWGFTSFIVGSAKYTVLYSSFAIVILMLIWLYINWLVLLLGASIAFYYQNPAYQTIAGERLKLTTRGREALALEILRLVGDAYQRGEDRWHLESLALRLNLPIESIVLVSEQLLERGLLVRVAEESPYFVPGRDLQGISINEVLNVISGDISQGEAGLPFAAPGVQKIIRELEVVTGEHLEGKTIKDLLPLSSSSNESAQP